MQQKIQKGLHHFRRQMKPALSFTLVYAFNCNFEDVWDEKLFSADVNFPPTKDVWKGTTKKNSFVPFRQWIVEGC
jgi:hypothetical protein